MRWDGDFEGILAVEDRCSESVIDVNKTVTSVDGNKSVN